MEAMLVVFFGLLVGWVCFALFAAGFAGTSGNWREEEDFYEYLNERSNRRVKPVGEIHRKQATPQPTKDSALVTLDGPEKLVQSLMERRAYYCFQSQSVDEARRIMREHHLQHLLVLDNKRRIVGTLRMSDLGDEDHPQTRG
jgi:CBS domain-containing protein